MLNKGLHSTEAQGSEFRVQRDLSDQVCGCQLPSALADGKDSSRTVAHSSQLVARHYVFPQNDFAYDKNQTKFEKEQFVNRKRLIGAFLPFAKGEYSRFIGREGVILHRSDPESAGRSVPNVPQTALPEAGEQGVKTGDTAQHALPQLPSILHLFEGEYSDGYSRREGVTITQMQTSRRLLFLPPWGESEGVLNLITSDFSEGTTNYILKLKLTKDDLENNKYKKKEIRKRKTQPGFSDRDAREAGYKHLLI